jgi:uncharacterized protein (DUF1800 family)
MMGDRAELRNEGQSRNQSMKALIKALAVLWATAMLVPAAQARVHDHIFAGEFETITDLPASQDEAARFLTQATFGPTTADIAHVMQVGYHEWIEQQLGMPATVGEAVVESVVNKRTADTVKKPGVGQSQRLNRWFWQATYAPDQLRQRMAFALSQIFVVSDQSSAISQDIVPMAAYQDLLAKDAFNIYVNVLHDVTYNPTMGKFLSTFHNQKANCTAPNVCATNADENYAREVMQLFSVGLILIDMDGSALGGMETPTYDQTVITHSAKVFTGFTYSDAPTNPANFYGGGSTTAATYAPMACWGKEVFFDGSPNVRHDQTGDDGTQSTSKSVLDGHLIAPDQDCSKDISDELNIINEHPNVAPFISRQLIQRFVTSNPTQGVTPTPGYVARIATVFENSGGDLGDVIEAILLDPEARTPPAFSDPTGPTYGKLREPLLRLTAMWRAFNAVAPAPDTYGEIGMLGGTGFQGSYGQAPLEAPTVFNFYPPDYGQPGTFADSGLFSPEFAIVNEATVYSMGNSFYRFTQGGYQGMTSPPTDRPLINLSALTANVANSAAFVQTLNDTMLYGSMSSAMQARMQSLVDGLASGASNAETAWSAIYLTMLSPEYATQR